MDETRRRKRNDTLVPLTVNLLNADGTPFGFTANSVTVPSGIQVWLKVLPTGTPYQGAGTVVDTGATDDNQLAYTLTAADADPQLGGADAERVAVQIRAVDGGGAQNTFPVGGRLLMEFETDFDGS